MQIYKLGDFSRFDDMCVDFIDSSMSITESKNRTDYKEIQSKVVSDLNLNISFVATFGSALTTFYPIVDNLIKNTQINIDMTPEKVVLLTIAAISIIYLEEKKDREEGKLRKDCKSMLEELKMSGIGNGIVKKMVDGLKSIRNIFTLIGKHVGVVATKFMDMFSYTALFILSFRISSTLHVLLFLILYPFCFEM